MIGFAVAHTNGIELLDWIYANSTKSEHRMISADHFADLVDRGDLEVVRWIHHHGSEFPESMLDAATGLGNLELAQFLYEHGGKTSGGCLRQTMGLAAEFGHLGVIEYLFENNPEAFASGRGCNHHHTYTLGYPRE